MRWNRLLIIIIPLLSIITGLFFYHLMPARMPIHFGLNGNPDSFGSRFTGVFALPISICLVVAVLYIVPRVAPEESKVGKNYESFVAVVLIVLYTIYLQMLLSELNIRISAIVPTSVAILQYSIGYFLQRSERGRIFGLRTRWTLSSDQVWKKTHDMMGILFKLSAFVVFLGVFLPDYQYYLISASWIATPAIGMLYSFYAYKRN